MRILFIAPMNSIHSKRWIKYFIKKNHSVEIIDSAQTGEEFFLESKIYKIVWPLGGSNIIKLFKYRRTFKKHIEKIDEVIRNFNPDIIHIHWIYDEYAYAAAKCSFHPIISTPWGSDLIVYPKNIFKKLVKKVILKKVIKKSERFICDAEHLKKELKRFGICENQIDIINFGTDTKYFHPSKKDGNLSKELGFNDSNPIVLSNRGLKQIYNVETFIKAIPLVLNKFPDIRFIIVGDGEQREMLENLSKKLRIKEYVKFTGRLSDEDMVRYTASADIYVSTSLSDGGLAASTAEAMSCAVPVIITDFGQNDEWVEKGKAGLTFPLKDEESLAKKIIELLSDTNKQKKMGKAAREVILERNNYYKEMSKVEDIYKKLSDLNRRV